VEEVALIAHARRDLLLRVHRHRLRREDLEECFSQATLELLARAREGVAYASTAHLANVLEQRFLSRIHDTRRALSGRSPMRAALELAIPLDSLSEEEVHVIDRRAELEPMVLVRDELRRVERLAGRLTFDQRLVLASQLGQVDRATFCDRYGWSEEKYRKVAQRARARLSRLMARELDRVAVPERARVSEGAVGTAHDEINITS
jgi:DNA-directed RNA polymerase specialized sigma24 family protein